MLEKYKNKSILPIVCHISYLKKVSNFLSPCLYFDAMVKEQSYSCQSLAHIQHPATVLGCEVQWRNPGPQ